MRIARNPEGQKSKGGKGRKEEMRGHRGSQMGFPCTDGTACNLKNHETIESKRRGGEDKGGVGDQRFYFGPSSRKSRCNSALPRNIDLVKK